MFGSIDEAIKLVNSYDETEDKRLEAAEYLVNNRDKLVQRVFFSISGELHSNTDPKWDVVKANSQERCSCGNERVIIPVGLREKYQPSSISHVLGDGNELAFKPIGGEQESTYVHIEIEDEAMKYVLDPYAPFILTMDIFSTKRITLSNLVTILAKGEPVLIYFRNKELAVPVFEITSVDLQSGTLTVVPDVAIEAFVPERKTD